MSLCVWRSETWKEEKDENEAKFTQDDRISHPDDKSSDDPDHDLYAEYREREHFAMAYENYKLEIRQAATDGYWRKLSSTK